MFGQNPNASKGQLSAAAKSILAKAHHIQATQQALDLPARLADYDILTPCSRPPRACGRL